MKYHIAFTPTAKAYDPRTKQFLHIYPTKPLSWPAVVSLFTRKPKEGKDGMGVLPSRIKKTVHPKVKPRSKAEHYWRCKRGCVDTSLLVLDIENFDVGGDDPQTVEEWLRGHLEDPQALIYTSWNHGVPGKWEKDHPRLRIVLPLSRPVDSHTEYPHLYQWAIALFGGAVDEGCKDPSRISYTMRARNPEAVLEPWSLELKGETLDPDALPTLDGDEVSVSELAKLAEEQKAAKEQERLERLKGLKSGVLTQADDSKRRKYALGTLKGVCEDIRQAPMGDRHKTLISKSALIGGMIEIDVLDEAEARHELVEAGCQAKPECSTSEIERIVETQLAHGKSNIPFDWSRLSKPDLSQFEIPRDALKEMIKRGSMDITAFAKKKGGDDE